MAQLFRILPDGNSQTLDPVLCRDENRELQIPLLRNHDLLPGDQIDPDDPCRWLLIRREMPVPDPGTAQDRWSIDFVFADQRAIPTFVECKRFNDTRSRREVVGQMIEYAANGHHYWDRARLREMAESTAVGRGMSLDEELDRLQPVDDLTADSFFERMEENLREGQLRIIFFLDEAPVELRSIVDFLNRQLERSEVLLVEARQFEDATGRFVVPRLFGYTEQARMVKRSVTVEKRGSNRYKWDECLFFEHLASGAVAQPVSELAARLRDLAARHPKSCMLAWGTGKSGSMTLKRNGAGLVEVHGGGEICFRPHRFPEALGVELSERYRRELEPLFPKPMKQAYPNVPPEDAARKAAALGDLIERVVDEAERRGESGD